MRRRGQKCWLQAGRFDEVQHCGERDRSGRSPELPLHRCDKSGEGKDELHYEDRGAGNHPLWFGLLSQMTSYYDLESSRGLRGNGNDRARTATRGRWPTYSGSPILPDPCSIPDT